ncbi:gliding motility-associated C-terminal domain-containing protein [Bacteroidota bacterium]
MTGDSVNFVDLSAGKYMYTITEGSGCVIYPSDSIELIGGTGTTADAGSDQTICADSVYLSANSPAAGETGSWTLINGSGIIDNEFSNETWIRNLGEGQNTFRWTIAGVDSICYSIDELDIIRDCSVDCNDFIVAASSQDATCSNGSDGSIQLVIPTGFSGNYMYYFQGDTTAFSTSIVVVPELTPNSYTVVVRDFVYDCYDTLVNVVVGLNNSLTSSAIKTDPSCNASDGGIIISTNGGTEAYTYLLIKNSNDSTINDTGIFTGLGVGTYDYLITDDTTGCTIGNQGIILDDNSTLQATADPTSFVNSSCYGEPLGHAVINVTGGTGSYEYSVDGSIWQSFVTGNEITDLPPNGTYSVLVREDASTPCYDSAEVTILNEYEQITVSFSITDASCDNNDGVVNIESITGGLAPYEISFSNQPFETVDLSNLPEYNGLPSGTFTIQIRDAVLCTILDNTAYVDDPGAIIANITEIAPSCNGQGLNGTITISIDPSDNVNPPPYRLGIGRYDQDVSEVTMHDISASNFIAIDTLQNGSYFTLLSSVNGGCETRTDHLISGGPYSIDFDTTNIKNISCKGSTGSVTIINLTGNTSLSYRVELISLPSNNVVYSDTRPYADFVNGFTIDGSVTDNIVVGNYQVRISQDDNGCSVIEVSGNFEITEPVNILDFVVTDSIPSFPDLPTGSITIRVQASGGGLYEVMAENISPLFPGQETFVDWEQVMPSNENPNIYEHTLVELYAGTYEITVADNYDCEIVKEIELSSDLNIFIPNVFTPNNDGVNDYFYVRNLPQTGTQMIISNRWGRIVFESSDYNYDNLWDGEGVLDGIYFYTMSVPSGNTYNGWVEVWRGKQR